MYYVVCIVFKLTFIQASKVPRMHFMFHNNAVYVPIETISWVTELIPDRVTLDTKSLKNYY
jgi:hypothetical protein